MSTEGKKTDEQVPKSDSPKSEFQKIKDWAAGEIKKVKEYLADELEKANKKIEELERKLRS